MPTIYDLNPKMKPGKKATKKKEPTIAAPKKRGRPKKT